jgi:hypothetical protein
MQNSLMDLVLNKPGQDTPACNDARPQPMGAEARTTDFAVVVQVTHNVSFYSFLERDRARIGVKESGESW